MGEIKGSPLSMHDLGRLKNVIAQADVHEYRSAEEYENDELVISSKRFKSSGLLRIYGVTVRVSDKLGLNEGMYIRQGRQPTSFNFEES